MRRAVSLILIPIVLASQGLWAAAHTHAGTGAGNPPGHAARPHVHVFGGHHNHGDGHSHAHHGEGDPSLGDPSPTRGDHDDNAIYAPEWTTARTNPLDKKVDCGSLLLTPWLSALELPEAVIPRLSSWWQFSPPFLDAHCPLFLRKLCILC